MLGLAFALTGIVSFALALRRGVAALRVRRAFDTFAEIRAHYADERYEMVPLRNGPQKLRLDQHPANRALAALDFRPVGDRIDPGKVSTGTAHRLLLSADGTIVAFFHADVPNVYLESVTATDEYVTAQGPREYVALPPTYHRQWVAPDTSLAKLVAAHIKLVGKHALVTFSSVEEVDARFKEAWERIVRWRNSHSDDELLDLDLRLWLGVNYDTTVAHYRHYMVKNPPAARVHRRTKA